MWDSLRKTLTAMFGRSGERSVEPKTHIFTIDGPTTEPTWKDGIVLRVVGGALGLLFVGVGTVTIWMRDELIGSLLCIAFGLVLLRVALYAKTKDVQDWFGGI